MIGILGGTFDPVHRGHISIATEVMGTLGLESLELLPCARPVHREPSCSSAEDRLAMLQLAVRDCPGLVVNDLEIQRGGASYTVDTLELISATTTQPLAFVIGSDAFNGFAQWKQPQRILELANLVVCHRPGVSINPDLYADCQTGSVEHFRQSHSGNILSLQVTEIHCSSTAVRQAIEEERQPTDCIPQSVLHYIAERNLYRRQGA